MTHTKDEALKLALEFIDSVKVHPTQIAARDAIHTTIKQALAATAGHRDGHWCVDLTCKKCYSADFRLKHTTPPAAPVQEPVYHLRQFGDVTKEQLDRYMSTGDINPQPAPVPLTDEQIQKIWDVASGAIPGWSRHITYARAIEAAHGITEKGQP